MVEWRDDDKDSNEVEDILREVIVISDDEDDEGSVEMGSQREDSGEIISKHVVANDLQTRPVDYSSTDDFNTYNRPYSPDDSRASRTTYVRPVRNPYNGPSHGHLFKRQQAHRSRIWGDAVYRRRNAENPLHPTAGQLKQYPVSTEVQPVVPIEQYQRPQVVEPRQHFHPIFDDGARLDANFHGNKALALSDVSSSDAPVPAINFAYINELLKNVYSSQSQAKAHVLPRSLNQGHERPRRSWPFSTPQEKLSRYSDSYSSSHVPTNEIRGQDHLESSNIVSEDILPSIERDLEGAGGPIHYHDTTGQLSPRGPRIIELADDYFEAINARNENDFKRRKTDPPPSPLRLPQNREYVQHDGQRLVVPTNYQGWTTPLVREPATTYPMSSYDPQYRYDMQPVEGPRPTYFRQLPFRENEAFQSSVNSQPMPLQGRPNQVVYIERRPEDVKRTPAKSRQWEEAHVPIPRTGYIPCKYDPSDGVYVDPFIHGQPVLRRCHGEDSLNTKMKHIVPSKREYVKPQPVRHDYDYLQPVQNAGYIVRSPNHWESWENHDARRTVFPPQGSQRSSEDHYLSRESSKREGTYTQSFRNQMRIDAQGSYVVAEPKPRSPAPRDFRATTTRQPIFISASPPLEEWSVLIVELIVRLANNKKGIQTLSDVTERGPTGMITSRLICQQERSLCIQIVRCRLGTYDVRLAWLRLVLAE